MMNKIAKLPTKDVLALGYRQLDRGGFTWTANEPGLRFVSGVEDWSPQRLVAGRGWSFWDKGSHDLYVARSPEGGRYLVKVYRMKKSSVGILSHQVNKARKEFYNTLFAYRKGFKTVLPVALGEKNEDRQCGVIVYPFLENSITLDKAYEPGCLAVSERHYLEKSIGRMMRKCMESGIFPVNMCPGHFLAKREEEGGLVVYWVDFEKIKLKSFRRKRFGIKSLAKLLARLEWYRISGGQINHASMMRIAGGCFNNKTSGKLNKRLCRAVIQATREYWQYRKIDTRGLYPLHSI